MLIRSGEAPGIGWSRNMLYSGFITLPRSVFRRQTGFAARITRTLSRSTWGGLLRARSPAEAVRQHLSRSLLPYLSHLLERYRGRRQFWPIHLSQAVFIQPFNNIPTFIQPLKNMLYGVLFNPTAAITCHMECYCCRGEYLACPNYCAQNASFVYTRRTY